MGAKATANRMIFPCHVLWQGIFFYSFHHRGGAVPSRKEGKLKMTGVLNLKKRHISKAYANDIPYLEKEISNNDTNFISLFIICVKKEQIYKFYTQNLKNMTFIKLISSCTIASTKGKNKPKTHEHLLCGEGELP